MSQPIAILSNDAFKRVFQAMLVAGLTALLAEIPQQVITKNESDKLASTEK